MAATDWTGLVEEAGRGASEGGGARVQDAAGRRWRPDPAKLPRDPGTLPNKIANATDFYCDTLNFVAIRRFSAATVVFRCVRVTCCHKNFSVAIKIVIVATR